MKKYNNSYDRWIWFDLEMTGLDENLCAIIQAAMIITDTELNEIASTEITIWQPQSLLLNMNPVVRKMHTENGLLKLVRSSAISIEDAQFNLMNILTAHVDYQKGYLAGSSVYIDRKFLAKYMPVIDNYLHYKILDVSSIKLLISAWGNVQIPKKFSQHLALSDLKDSIQDLKFFRARFFNKN